MTTVVANIHHCPKGWEHDPSFAYIGRPGKGQGGYFGNPYRLPDEDSRNEVIALFYNWFHNRLRIDSDYRDRVNALKDKTLVCFCAPKKCHGDVIAEYLNE